MAKFLNEKRQGVLGKNARKAINKDLKVRLIMTNIIVMFSFFLIVSLFLYSKFSTSLDHPMIGIFLPILFLFFIFCGVSAYLNLFLAFKASAPIYRLENYFKTVSDRQEILPLSFRKDDYYNELPSLIIESFHRLEKKNLQ